MWNAFESAHYVANTHSVGLLDCCLRYEFGNVRVCQHNSAVPFLQFPLQVGRGNGCRFLDDVDQVSGIEKQPWTVTADKTKSVHV